MTEKQLKEIIKAKEQELKELKAQLKALEEVKEETTKTVSYFEIVKLDSNSIRTELEKLDAKQIKKIAREGGIRVISSAKAKCIEEMVNIINARNNKGIAFK